MGKERRMGMKERRRRGKKMASYIGTLMRCPFFIVLSERALRCDSLFKPGHL